MGIGLTFSNVSSLTFEEDGREECEATREPPETLRPASFAALAASRALFFASRSSARILSFASFEMGLYL